MPSRYYFRDKVEIESASSAAENLDYRAPKTGRIYYFEEIVVENKTTGFTRLLFGVLRVDDFHPYEEQQSPAAATLYPWHPATPLRMFDTETLRAACTGVTSGDNLVMHVAGHFELMPKAEGLPDVEPVEAEL